MSGTVLITGANGSLGLPFVQQILTSHPSCTIIATVRNSSTDSDPNTARLSQVISSYPGAHATIEPLDLSSLENVRSFADALAQRISSDQIPPLSAIVCNAFTWSLNRQLSTPDGFERTFQVCHLSHHLLVLKLLGSMSPQGRVVMLGSTAHYPDRPNPLSKLVAEFPNNIEELIKPPQDAPGEEHGRGFQRYGNAKLANVMFMHDLNARLQKDPNLSAITVTAMDPGGILDSRAHTHQKPSVRAIFSIANMLMPILRHLTTDVRRAADSARDLVELSVGSSFQGARGYYVGSKPGESAKASQAKEDCNRLWNACWKWTAMREEETALVNAAAN